MGAFILAGILYGFEMCIRDRRKSEFDTLQAQINPHFLYNTLDIIVWMIENENLTDAVRVVTALARFFRISLSRGKSIITVRDELELSLIHI